MRVDVTVMRGKSSVVPGSNVMHVRSRELARARGARRGVELHPQRFAAAAAPCT